MEEGVRRYLACADRALDGSRNFEAAIEAVKMRIKKVRDGRLGMSRKYPMSRRTTRGC